MSLQPAENRPSDVVAENGKVLVDGPDGTAITMTPAAAEETAHRLLRAAEEARGQDPARETAD